MTNTVGILGGGAWGTALALVAAHAGGRVLIWARDAATVEAINTAHENKKRLPGVALPPDIAATADIGQAARADTVVLAVGAQAVRGVTEAAAGDIAPATPIVIAAKGLERGTAATMTEVVADLLPAAPLAVLSGPSFAADVAAGLPTAVTVAARDAAVAAGLCRCFAGPRFRPYSETDVIGVEMGGAVKNVLAIAAGIVAGRGLGASAGAAVVARGFAELRRLGDAAGARSETLMGLSGLGDLVLTCTSGQSRNFVYGLRLGRGEAAETGVLAEGVTTAAATVARADTLGVDMPIATAVAAILDDSLAVDEAVEQLLSRPLRAERD